jgi:hypothetical protein
VIPLGQIDLPVTLRDPTNYRMETLTFKVVRFLASYHAMLGRPRYMKFMAVPNYTYLKLKMPSPRGFITIRSSFQRANQCEVESCKLASAVITFKLASSDRLPSSPTVHWSLRMTPC